MRKSVLPFVLPLLFVGAFTACSHSPKRSSSPSSTLSKSDSKLESAASNEVEKTEEDERLARQIEKDINAIFFHGKAENPGGLHAFSPDRIQELELEIMETSVPSIRYYRENREFFDRVEDAGGGFRVVSNAKRLVPYRRTVAGRAKLFKMDASRVREMITNPCFSEIEDCGEYASDGEENTSLLEDWTKKYAEAEFRPTIEKVLRNYLGALEKYQKRVAHGIPKKVPRPGAIESKKVVRAKQADLVVGTHIRRIQEALKARP